MLFYLVYYAIAEVGFAIILYAPAYHKYGWVLLGVLIVMIACRDIIKKEKIVLPKYVVFYIPACIVWLSIDRNAIIPQVLSLAYPVIMYALTVKQLKKTDGNPK